MLSILHRPSNNGGRKPASTLLLWCIFFGNFLIKDVTVPDAILINSSKGTFQPRSFVNDEIVVVDGHITKTHSFGISKLPLGHHQIKSIQGISIEYDVQTALSIATTTTAQKVPVEGRELPALDAM